MKKIITQVLLWTVLAFARLTAQIPNAGFESWDNQVGYYNPQNWYCMNDQLYPAVSASVVERSTDAHSGTYAAKVKPVELIPGKCIHGALANADFMVIDENVGQPFSSRPASFKGYMKRVVQGMDTLRIEIKLSKWDGTKTKRVAEGVLNLFGTQSTYQPFSVTLNYFSNDQPDTVFISMMIGRNFKIDPDGNKNSYFIVDDLSFEGTVPVGMAGERQAFNQRVYPNPLVNGILTIEQEQAQTGLLEVYDLCGLLRGQIPVNSSKQEIDLTFLAPGFYQLRLNNSSFRVLKQ